MKHILITLVIIFASSCATVKHKEYAINTSSYHDGNSGVALFRTVRASDTGGNERITVQFKRLDTGEYISNVPLGFGRHDGTEFALRLPPGEYELTSLLFYEGRASSKEDSYRFQIEEGENIYLGTLMYSYSMPQNTQSYGTEASRKTYFDVQYCGFVVCSESPVDVYVFHDGRVPKELTERFPMVPRDQIQVRLIN